MSKKRDKPKIRDKTNRDKLKFRGTGPKQDKRGATLHDRPLSTLRTAKPVSFDSAMTLSAVFACVKILVESVATLPLQMFKINKDGTRTQVKDHDLIRLLNNKPNRYQTRVEFFEQLMLNLVAGNSFGKRDYIGKKLTSIQIINSGSVDLKLDDKGNPIYQCQINGQKVEYSEKDIWHVRLFGTGLMGMSPIAYGAQSIGIGLAGNDKTTRLMSNGAKPTGALKTEKYLKKEQRDALRGELDILINGDDGDLAVLEGNMQFEKISLTPEDIELLSTRRFTVEEICRFYGVPSVLINDTSGSTVWGSGIEQLVESFYRFGLRPYFERIEESARLNLLDRVDWDTYEFEFKIKDLLRASITTRIANNKARIESGQSTINEVRIEEGYAPIEGGDNLMLASNLITLDRVVTGQTGQGE